MYTVRRELLPIAQKNIAALDAVDTYAEVVNDAKAGMDFEMGFADGDEDGGGYVAKSSRLIGGSNPSDFIIDIREYDIPYYLRVAIDKGEGRSIATLSTASDLTCSTLTAVGPLQKFELDCGIRSPQNTARFPSSASRRG